jgi:hypothetical protein
MTALGRIDNKVGKNLIIQTSTDVTGFDKVELRYRYIFANRKLPAPNLA